MSEKFYSQYSAQSSTSFDPPPPYTGAHYQSPQYQPPQDYMPPQAKAGMAYHPPAPQPDAQPAPQPNSDLSPLPNFLIDFQWKKMHGTISTDAAPKQPLYILNCMSVKSPHIKLRSAHDDRTIGTGTIHPVQIDAKYEFYGQPGTLKALSRLKTQYTFLSRAFSNTGAPVAMKWTGSMKFKTWDFVCTDENEMPVAKYSINMWSFKKLGKIEFMGNKAIPQLAREEILLTGITLGYCMYLRVNNIGNLAGAMAHKPGPLKDEAEAAKRFGGQKKSKKSEYKQREDMQDAMDVGEGLDHLHDHGHDGDDDGGLGWGDDGMGGDDSGAGHVPSALVGS